MLARKAQRHGAKQPCCSYAILTASVALLMFARRVDAGGHMRVDSHCGPVNLVMNFQDVVTSTTQGTIYRGRIYDDQGRLLIQVYCL